MLFYNRPIKLNTILKAESYSYSASVTLAEAPDLLEVKLINFNYPETTSTKFSKLLNSKFFVLKPKGSYHI